MKGISGKWLLVGEIFLGIVSSVLLAILFAKWSSELFKGDMRFYDNLIGGIIYSLRTPLLTSVMLIITKLGAGFTLVVMGMMTILFAWEKHRKEALLFIIILVMGLVINMALKNLIARPRPNLEPLVVETTYSYPSGHAMNSMVFYSAVAFFMYHFSRRKKWSVAFYGLSCLLIGLIGFSRVYLGVHYPSDVVAGWVIGLWWLVTALLMEKTMVFWRLVKRWEKG